MRPVNRGPIPQEKGADKVVSDYKDWRLDLLERMGNYCSYCNMVLNDSPQVEHVSPKSTNPALLLAWDNMLLACGPCNRAKSDKSNNATTHYLPDHHNTHLAFTYVVIDHPKKINQKACIPVPSSNGSVDQQKAQNSISLCSLDAVKINARATDLRWKYRFEAWMAAVEWKKAWDRFGHTQSQEFIRLLTTAVTGKGFFSIWFKVFENDPQVKLALLQAYPGTDTTAFDHKYDAIPKQANDL